MAVWTEVEPKREIKTFRDRKIIYVENPKKVVDKWARILGLGGLLLAGALGYETIGLAIENQKLNSQLIYFKSDVVGTQNTNRIRLEQINSQVKDLKLETELTSFGACLDRWGFLDRRPDYFNPEICRAENQAKLKLFRERK